MRLHRKAGYMAAPERFAQMSDFPLATRAPSIHGTSLHSPLLKLASAFGDSKASTGFDIRAHRGRHASGDLECRSKPGHKAPQQRCGILGAVPLCLLDQLMNRGTFEVLACRLC